MGVLAEAEVGAGCSVTAFENWPVNTAAVFRAVVAIDANVMVCLLVLVKFNGSLAWDRTKDLSLIKRMLCQLSYWAVLLLFSNHTGKNVPVKWPIAAGIASQGSCTYATVANAVGIKRATAQSPAYRGSPA